MIEQIVIVLHILVALAIVALILLQQGKGADMGASFGGGGSQTLFGATGGGNVLTRATAILAAVFFATSFGLAIIAKQKAGLVAETELLSVPTAFTEQLDAVSGEQAASDIQASFDQLPEFDSVPDAINAEAQAVIDDAAAIIDQDIVDSIPE